MAEIDTPEEKQRRKARDKFIKDYVDAIFRIAQMVIIIGLFFYAGKRAGSGLVQGIGIVLGAPLAFYAIYVPHRAIEDWDAETPKSVPFRRVV